MSEDRTKLVRPVYIISDSTGETAEQVTRAALRQFRGHLVHVRTFSHVTTPDLLTARFLQAARRNAMVVSTLVGAQMRQHAARLAEEHGVRHLDLLGPLLIQLAAFLELSAIEVPGLMREVDDRYFRRIEAVEFTVKVDDGKEPRMLTQADIVLVGVSRTSKTPLSTFLAHKGYKVGNVPLVLDRPPPDQLFRIDPRRVFALTIDPDALQSIRTSRLRAMGMSKSNYSDMDYILAELEQAGSLFNSHPKWPVIDVTNRAVEETAATILSIFRDRGLAHESGDLSSL